MLKTSLIIFNWILSCGILHGQRYTLNDFICYSVKEGLSDNYVTSIQQDEQGYLWVGTDAGLNRFDGYTFNTYSHGSRDIPLLSHKILRLKMFASNHLAILTRGGFQLLNAKTFSLQNYLVADTTPFSTFLNSVSDARQLPDRSVALSTASGYYTFTRDGKMMFRRDAYTEKDIGKTVIRYGRDILAINDEEYLIYVEKGKLAYYNAKQQSFREIDSSEKRWSLFYKPPTSYNHNWIVKQQVSPTEYMFIHFEENTLTYYDIESNKVVTSPLPIDCRKEFNFESKVTVLDDTAFVINASNQGFYLFSLNRSSGKVSCLPEKFLPTIKINCLFKDKTNRLWAGTPSGLLQQKIHKPFLQLFSISSSELENDRIGNFSGVISYKNKIYVARYSNEIGLAILDSSMKLQKTISFFNKEKKWNEVLSMQRYHTDTLWLGTNSGVIWLDTKTNHYGIVDEFNKFNFDLGSYIILGPPGRDGNAWFCYMLRGIAGRYHIPSRSFTFFTTQTTPALPFTGVKHITYDTYGDVWIAGHSLTKWDNRQGLFDTVITAYAGSKKFNDNILCLSSSDNGSIWMHNEENGLLEYVITEKKFNWYTTSNGLPTNAFEGFSPVVNGMLWMAGVGYLTGFDTRSKKAIVYGYRDGFPMEKLSTRIIFYDSLSRYFYIVFRHSLVKFPSTPHAPPNYSSPLLIQEVIVNNGKSIFHPEKEMRFNRNENDLVIRCGIIDFETTAEYNFSYKINKAETWTSLGRERNITLTDLPPGRYIIDIKATGKMGEEKATQASFYIAPPFWRTWWFVFIVLLTLCSGIILLYRRRIHSIRQKANIDKLLVQTEMKALHSQMNPHFIFNSLNSIREMILNKENNEASHYLSKFAHLMRVTLDQSEQTFVTLQSTVDYLHRYIEMEQIRNTNFRFSISIDDALPPDTLLPPMLIQPFIENAIWHGTGADRTGIEIRIGFRKHDNTLVCTVGDNGIGINQSMQYKSGRLDSHHSRGITNIRNRIRLLNEKYKLQSSVTIVDKANLPGSEESGTLVTLRLPLEIPE